MVRDGQVPGKDPTPRFVTASLQVDYLKPTPLGPELVLRARAVEVGQKKVVVEQTISAGDTVVVKSRVVAVRAPENMRPK
jgi:acyl-CoA thioesterase FadM